MQSFPVLVVGSGPSGLVLALCLLKNGIQVRIIEKLAQFHHGVRGPGLMPRTLEIGKFLGISEDIKEALLPAPTMHFYEPDDPYLIARSINPAEELEYTPAFPTTSAAVLSQWKHEEVLRKHVEAQGGQIELGTSFVGLEQDEDGVVVELAQEKDGEIRTEKSKFSYVIGADGAHSLIRKSLGVTFSGETRDSGQFYIIDAHLEGIKGGSNIYHWGDTKTKLVRIRGTHEADSFQIIFIGDESDLSLLKNSTDIDTVQKVMNSVIEREDIRILEIIWRGEWRPNIRMADHFCVGRVLIVGDAAHVHPPTGGQGLNSSVQDSFNLGWKLALAVKGLAAPDLLDSYEIERLPVIAEMLRLSTGIFDKMANFKALHHAEEVMKAEAEANKSNQEEDAPWFRGRKLFQLDLHYRWSPAVFDERFASDGLSEAKNDVYGTPGRALQAGDRAPDAPDLIVQGGDAKTRIFDIIDPTKHIALVFADIPTLSDALSLYRPLKQLGAGLVRTILVLPKGSTPSAQVGQDGIDVLLDSEGHAYTGYGILSKEPVIVAIRPDGMVGAFIVSKLGAEKYVSSVFNF